MNILWIKEISFELERVIFFDPILELKERFSNIGLKYNNGKIRINGGVYSPKFKVQSQKWAFLRG